MSESKIINNGGIGLCGALFLLFLALRLTDHIDWAWYWIGAPLWIPVALFVAIVAVATPIMVVCDRVRRKRRAARSLGPR